MWLLLQGQPVGWLLVLTVPSGKICVAFSVRDLTLYSPVSSYPHYQVLGWSVSFLSSEGARFRLLHRELPEYIRVNLKVKDFVMCYLMVQRKFSQDFKKPSTRTRTSLQVFEMDLVKLVSHLLFFLCCVPLTHISTDIQLLYLVGTPMRSERISQYYKVS